MRRLRLSALLVLSAIGPVSAHRLDEYLQATLIGVTPHGIEVELQLTPGIAILPGLMTVIDQDRDGRISQAEARAYAARVLRDVELRAWMAHRRHCRSSRATFRPWKQCGRDWERSG